MVVGNEMMGEQGSLVTCGRDTEEILEVYEDVVRPPEGRHTKVPLELQLSLRVPLPLTLGDKCPEVEV